MHEIYLHKAGLVMGGMMAIVYAVWALMVAINMAKPFMDYIFGLHFINFQYTIIGFSFGTAFMLIIVTAVIGYLMGLVLGRLRNYIHKTSHPRTRKPRAFAWGVLLAINKAGLFVD